MVKINKVFGRVLSLVSMLMVMACSDQLEIEPEGILTEDQVFNSAGTTELALGAVYYSYMTNSVGSAYMYGDVTTHNVEVSGLTDFTVINAEFAEDDAFVSGVWSGLYATINLANNLINKVQEIGTYEEEIENQHIAEAKFLRANCYFNLLKFYGDGALTGEMNGMGVPIQLDEYDGTGIGEFIPRNTNGEVYDQIILDLTESIPHLPSSYGDLLSTASRATSGSAYALLARAYLYARAYESAAESANQVIIGMNYELEADLRTLFPTTPISAGNGGDRSFTSEDIFNLPIGANNSLSFATSTNQGKNNIFYDFTNSRWVSTDLIGSFGILDNRKQQLIVEGWTGNTLDEGFDEFGNQLTTNLMTYKFGPRSEENVPNIRLAEVILTRAEALARVNGLNQESVDLLNQTYQRAKPLEIPLELADFSNADALINRILLERRMELMFENHERYDLIRTGRKDQLANPDLPDNKLVMPIPQLEVDLSRGIIQQNSGYSY